MTLMDVGSCYNEEYLGKYKLNAVVVLLCYQVDGIDFEWIEDVTDTVGRFSQTLVPFFKILKWCPIIREHYRNVPVILVGMTTDERDTARSDDLHPASSYNEGLACAKTINAAAFVECSSASLESVNQMFETAFRLALVSKSKGPPVQSPPRQRRLSRWWKGYKAK